MLPALRRLGRFSTSAVLRFRTQYVCEFSKLGVTLPLSSTCVHHFQSFLKKRSSRSYQSSYPPPVLPVLGATRTQLQPLILRSNGYNTGSREEWATHGKQGKGAFDRPAASAIGASQAGPWVAGTPQHGIPAACTACRPRSPNECDHVPLPRNALCGSVQCAARWARSALLHMLRHAGHHLALLAARGQAVQGEILGQLRNGQAGQLASLCQGLQFPGRNGGELG